MPHLLLALWMPLMEKLFFRKATTQPAIACSKLTIETLEQGVKQTCALHLSTNFMTFYLYALS